MRAGWVIAMVFVLALAGGGAFAWKSLLKAPTPPPPPPPTVHYPIEKVIGKSVQGRNIESFTYGDGDRHIVFVGGIHGGYEWNSVLVAYNFKDYLDAHPEAVAKNEKVTVIVNANPDAVFEAVGKEGRFTLADVPKSDLSSARFNANDVDLNRNFDCNWKSTGTWQNKSVKTGTKAFSEPEAEAIRDYVLSESPTAFVFWHSAAGAVYASQCNDGILPGSLAMMNSYATASGYKAVKSFDAYPVYGASEDWLASQGIPAVTVELKSHDEVEWEQNLKGSLAVLQHFATATTTGQ